jgi:uncharacterized membrane protein
LGFAPRRVDIDWGRGIAVLLMIEAHTLDAWTAPAAHNTVFFRNLNLLGGFAAPLFLWLAGLVGVFSAERVAARAGNRMSGTKAVCRRGLEIFVLAFLFRLQAFVVTPGSHPIMIFRVDILNIMGPALVAAGVMWWLLPDRRILCGAYVMMALAIGMATPVVRTAAAVGMLPVFFQWYIRPAGDLTAFTAFPWMGFVLAGAAHGVLLLSARDQTLERRRHVGVALVGAVVLTAGLYASTLPSLYEHSSFWTNSPAYFAVRAGVLAVALSALWALSRCGERFRAAVQPLEKFGRNSLFVYWIHVELVYGYATWAIHHRLPIWGTLVASSAFAVLMYAAITAKDRVAAMRLTSQPYLNKDVAV